MLEETLRKFETDLVSLFGDDLVDIMIFGSVSLGDFTPRKGDIDFIVALGRDVDAGQAESLFALHDGYRSAPIHLEDQLEGAYYPRRLLERPTTAGDGCYIGTRRRGWKRLGGFCHNSFDLLQLCGTARRLRASDTAVHRPGEAEIAATVLNDYDLWSRIARDDGCPSHDIVQWAARVYFYYANGRVGSKSESCEELSRRYPSLPFIRYCASVRHPVDKLALEKAQPRHLEETRLLLDLVRRDIVDTL